MIIFFLFVFSLKAFLCCNRLKTEQMKPSVPAAPDVMFFTLFFLSLKCINYEEFSTWNGTMVISCLRDLVRGLI